MNAASVSFQIFAIEEVGFGREGGGNPLPGEIVAGGVAIEEVVEEPLRTGLPTYAEPMREVGGDPHAGVVVEISGGGEFSGKGVDAAQGSGTGDDCFGDFGAEVAGGEAGFWGFAILPDGVADLEVDSLPVVAPS